MPVHACPPDMPGRSLTPLRRACLTGVWACACLLAVLPAACAHSGDSRPEPEMIGWGVVCLILMLTYLLTACFRAPSKARPRYQPTRPRRLRGRPRQQTGMSSLPYKLHYKLHHRLHKRKSEKKAKKMHKHSVNRSGFTLIELLVVIAIIAILAAILFPVFAQARASARKTVCMANMKQIILATRMYSDDYDGCFPRIQASDGSGNWTVVSWWAVHFYQQALDPYIKMGRGAANKQNVWWDPSDPSRNMPYMWGSFIDNGLLTCNNTSETAIEKPSETIFSALRAQAWDVATDTAPLPSPAPPADDPFWTSEYFDFGVDPYEKSDPTSPYWWSRGKIFPPCSLFPDDAACADWEALLDTRRYAHQSPYAFVDGHVKVMPFAQTYKSPDDNMWDLH